MLYGVIQKTSNDRDRLIYYLQTVSDYKQIKNAKKVEIEINLNQEKIKAEGSYKNNEFKIFYPQVSGNVFFYKNGRFDIQIGETQKRNILFALNLPEQIKIQQQSALLLNNDKKNYFKYQAGSYQFELFYDSYINKKHEKIIFGYYIQKLAGLPDDLSEKEHTEFLLKIKE